MQACLSTLEPTMWLGDSRLLFEPRANIELDQLSVLEVMQTLHSRGWAAIEQVQGRGKGCSPFRVPALALAELPGHPAFKQRAEYVSEVNDDRFISNLVR